MAINTPMTATAVVAYLGIVLAGCAAVSVADSFVAAEIASRLRVVGARAIFTQVDRPAALCGRWRHLRCCLLYCCTQHGVMCPLHMCPWGIAM